MFDYDLEPGKKLMINKGSNDDVLVSIITPFYSGDEFIYQTANSVLNQTFPYYEWIIVDDGSPFKKKEEVFRKLEKLDNRIKIYSKENEGLAATRDYGANKASKSSKYFVFLDDDDLLDKTFLETSYYTLETYSDAAWTYTDVVNFGTSKGEWKKHFDSVELQRNNFLVATAMIRKEAYLSVNGYGLKEKAINEDWIFWIKLLAKGYYPVHQSYNGFWYRRKEIGELSKSLHNLEKTQSYLDEYISQINSRIKAIEFPRDNLSWQQIPELNINIPKRKKDKKINLLAIIPWMEVGGADKFNVDLFNGLDKEKYHITVLTTQPTTYRWRQKFEKSSDVFELSSFLDRTYWPSFIEYIINSRNIDIIFNSNSLCGYEMLPYIKAKFPKIPIMDYIHMEEWYNRSGGYSRDSAAFDEVIDRTLLCNKNSSNILHDYFKKSTDKIDTVYIGVDEKKFDPSKYDIEELKKKYNIPSDKIIINFLARIDYQKRPFLFIEVAKKVIEKDDNVLFLVAGDGPLLKDIKAKAKEYKINDNIRFLGRTDTPYEIYLVSDISLNTSIKEGLALTSYESLSLGTPVVSSDVGGQKELINDEVGKIVPCMQEEKDVFIINYSNDEINNYVKAIFEVKNNLNTLKSNARKRVLNGFTIDKMLIKMDKEISNVVKNPNKDIIKIGENLSNNINMLKEYMNIFFMEDKKEYRYLCDLYYKNAYGLTLSQFENREKNAKINFSNKIVKKLYNFACKCNYKLITFGEKSHLYWETRLVIDFIKNLYDLFKSIILVLLIPIKFILLIIKRIINVFKKVL